VIGGEKFSPLDAPKEDKHRILQIDVIMIIIIIMLL
jgi:hypothetical protein